MNLDPAELAPPLLLSMPTCVRNHAGAANGPSSDLAVNGNRGRGGISAGRRMMNRTGSTRRRKAALASLCLVAMALAVAAGPARAAEGDAARAVNNEPTRQIDINKATAVELTAIPGVGTVIAQRIVDFRDEQGPFRRVEDLLKIRGIGEKSFQKIRPHVKVENSG